ncbi:LAGLIDADG DNA endonuclease family protein [Streptomyces sp. TLI_235]|nr:LAGLIDADG family homing endonuclease [Streptomyces sp. TLI_235]PBC77435.1 LAGLIDADG DNA endonuclease family protein [Streptomyces sp. TLI_235]
MTGFDLENPDHAYVFGFLQADGHLRQGPGNKGRLSVELSARDVVLLEEFRRICAWPSSVRHRTRSTDFAAEHTSAIWTVCAREFRERLEELGLPTGRKSSRVAPPRTPFAERDYLRGLIDADGSLGRTGQDLPFVSLTTASEALATYFCRYAHELTGAVRTARRNRRDEIYNILVTRENAVAMAQDLYRPKCLALPRKLAAAADLATWTRPDGMRKVPRRPWTADEDDLLLATGDAKAAATLLGRSVSSCATRQWRLMGPRKARVRFPRTPA